MRHVCNKQPPTVRARANRMNERICYGPEEIATADWLKEHKEYLAHVNEDGKGGRVMQGKKPPNYPAEGVVSWRSVKGYYWYWED